jgi:hypothetical protein
MKWSIFARKSNKCGDMEMLLYLFLRRFVRKDYTENKKQALQAYASHGYGNNKGDPKKKSPEE